MVAFSSDAEKKKWASLQNKTGLALQNIAKGTASVSDVQAVSNTLSGLNNLAKQTFDTAISAAEVSAKKFQKQYDNLTSDVNEAQLSAYEAALNKALAELAPDLIGQIKDILELDGLEQEDRDNVMGARLLDIQSLLPTKAGQIVTIDDLLTGNEMLVEDLQQKDEDRWLSERKKDLLDSIAEVFQGTLRDLAAKIKSEREPVRRTPQQQPEQHENNYPRLAAPTSQSMDLVPHVPSQAWDVVDADEAPLLSKAKSLIGASRNNDEATDVHTIDQEPNIQPSASTLKGDTNITLSKAAEQSVTQAADSQTSLYKQLMDFLDNPDGHKSGGAGSEDSDDKKADTWWRSFKNWMGDKFGDDSGGKKKKDSSDWLTGLGTMLVAMIMDPQLFIGLAKSIHDLMTWENIKEAATASWNFVKESASTVIDWVMDKLGIGKKHDDVTKDEADKSRVGGPDSGVKQTQSTVDRLKDPKVQAELAKIEEQRKHYYDNGAHADQKPNAMPAGDGSHASWQSKLSNFLGFKNGDETVTDRPQNATNPDGTPNFWANSTSVKGGTNNTSNSTSVAGGSTGDSNTTVNGGSPNTSNSSGMNVDNSSTSNTTVNGGSSVGSNRSSITNNATAGSVTNSTVSSPGTSVTVSPGTTTPPPSTNTNQSLTTPSSGQPAKGTSQIGMSTFGFHSSVDDSLPLMNSTYLVN